MAGVNYYTESARMTNFMAANYGNVRQYTPRAANSNSNYGIPRPNLNQFSNSGNKSNFSSGAGMASAGGAMNIMGLKHAAKAVMQAASFNSYIGNINMLRETEAITRQGNRLFSAQQSAVAASGFSKTSKSFLMVANETLDEVQTKLNETRYDFYQQDAANMFEARQQERAYRLDIMRQTLAMYALGTPKHSRTIQF